MTPDNVNHNKHTPRDERVSVATGDARKVTS